MPEGNGSGRLDRIEANLERLTERFNLMVEHHDHEFKQLLTWQVLMQDKMERMEAAREAERKRVDARLDALSEKTDQRIAELVLAIGKLIERLPERAG